MLVKPWLFLLAAIAAEISGVTTMKLVSDSGSWEALLFMYAMIGLSFYFLATTMQYLPMALTYATWETIGLIAIAFIGFRFFGEQVSTLKLVGMGVLLVGVMLVNLGVPHQVEES
ncbi:DMT family transporter [Paenalcaligenes suwonensis]|uniref:DMT family transporter n=1 Tax=Paenalcaligenes suwonensis TaxID=1202713 RepID=UPI001F619BFA|nr:multidrug efflux SMR transporter [Paenalcaligenes suwonensis]